MRRLFAIAACAAVLCFGADEKLPIEAFFRGSQYSVMRLSPDGKNIAALAPVNRRQNVVIIDVDKRTATPITSMESRDVVQVEWISDKRLLLTTGTLNTRDFEFRGGGLYAVDVDGSNGRLLGEGSDEQLAAGIRLAFRDTAQRVTAHLFRQRCGDCIGAARERSDAPATSRRVNPLLRQPQTQWAVWIAVLPSVTCAPWSMSAATN